MIRQIAVCILFSLPVPLILYALSSHLIFFAYILNLLIPLFVFYKQLKIDMGTGKKSEFSSIQTIIAILLWGICGGLLAGIHDSCFLGFSHKLYESYRIDRFSTETVLFAGYNVISISIVVVLSYIIAKKIGNISKYK